MIAALWKVISLVLVVAEGIARLVDALQKRRRQKEDDPPPSHPREHTQQGEGSPSS